MRNLTVKWRIFIFLIGFCAILLALLWLFQVVFLDRFYKTIKLSEIKSSAASIARNVDSENLADIVESISQSNDVCVEILDSKGNTLCSADVLRECLIHKMPKGETKRLINAAAEGGGEFLQYFSRENLQPPEAQPDQFSGRMPPPRGAVQESIILAKQVSGKDGRQVYIILNSVISPVTATVTTLRTQLYYITGIMLLFSVIFAMIIAKKIAAPIADINESAKALAASDYSVRFTGDGYREIGELSNTLNHAAVELSKVEGLRRELIANVSHDLRTPLTLIGGYAEAMRDLPGECNADNAQIIISETARLTTLVGDMLDISKLQSGFQTIEPLSYNLTASIRDTVGRLSKLVKKDGYTINFQYDSDITVTADQPRITQAFYNLLTNAINYTGTDKKITIRQTVENERVKIEVEDTGGGVSEDDLPYIWDRYYKVDKTHKRAVTGTGLGLSIVKSVIELHNGQYGVNSVVNKGSTFWFSLNI